MLPFLFIIYMKKNIEIIILVMCGLLFTVPFFNFYRYAPLGDWVTDGSFICLVGLLFLLTVRTEWILGPAAAALIMLIPVQLVSGGIFDGFVQICVIFIMFLLALNVSGIRSKILSNFRWLAAVVLLTSLVQALIAYAQFFGLARYFHGFIVYAMPQDRQIFGNFGQRNQFANFMAWGVISACYLYAIGSLRKVAFGSVLVLIVLTMTWSGSRTVIVYAAGMFVLAAYWYGRAKSDAVVKRMSQAVLISVVLIILLQLFSHQLVGLLRFSGIPVEANSGFDRFMEAGFGARRRVEWTKAWMIFKEHPWFGVGLGGYAYGSVWYEAFAGLPKVPESVLFTNCHNLIFQLLAETGLVGCGVVLAGLYFSLTPYLKRGNQSAENLFLLVIAMVLLGHSMLEYPLWYMPFCGMLVFVCAMSPAAALKGHFRIQYSAVLKVAIGVLCILYFLNGLGRFWFVVRYNFPVVSVAENKKTVMALAELQKDPLWGSDASYVLGNYLQPSREELDIKISFFDRLVQYRPYSEVLLKAAMLHSLNGDTELAHKYMTMAISAYPDDVIRMQVILRGDGNPDYNKLREIVDRAKFAWDAAGENTDAARLAAVMTVAAPVTRKAIF
ncbi:O-antigen ligase family protein [Aquitalea sp.]|uniref:PglL family O-oligosaccharyltransferase n=1 Tax=Aquitalea sp. TaxID=1872623 RepID=UPI002589E5E1|nr:O-antigen ligase family protein [Aquitalea sp.]